MTNVNLNKKLVTLLTGLCLVFFSLLSNAQISTSTAPNAQLSYGQGLFFANVYLPKKLSSGRSAINPIEVQLVDSTGAATNFLTAEWVTATAEMPSMPGMGVTKVTDIKDVLSQTGEYTGQLTLKPVFSMPGAWAINITMTYMNEANETVSETQSFSVEVK